MNLNICNERNIGSHGPSDFCGQNTFPLVPEDDVGDIDQADEHVDPWHFTDENLRTEDWSELPLDLFGDNLSDRGNEDRTGEGSCGIGADSRDNEEPLRPGRGFFVHDFGEKKDSHLMSEMEGSHFIGCRETEPQLARSRPSSVDLDIPATSCSFELISNHLKKEGQSEKMKGFCQGLKFEEASDKFQVYENETNVKRTEVVTIAGGDRERWSCVTQISEAACQRYFAHHPLPTGFRTFNDPDLCAGDPNFTNEVEVDVRQSEEVFIRELAGEGKSWWPRAKHLTVKEPQSAPGSVTNLSSTTKKRTVQGTLLGFLGLKRKAADQNCSNEGRQVRQKSISSYFRLKERPEDAVIPEEIGLPPREDLACQKRDSLVEISDGMEAQNLSWKAGSREIKTVLGGQQSAANAGNQGKRICPFYKKMPGTRFAVDAFSYGCVPGISAYFLTHFHSDHYGGLSKGWTHGPIYCTPVTASLARMCLGVDPRWLCPLKIGTTRSVDKVEVTFIPANHCPGAALILFRLPTGTTILHTGDFRACRAMQSYPHLYNCRIDSLYLDTTYCNPKYCFPLQDDVIQFVIATALHQMTRNKTTLVVVGSYSIGKERVFLALAQAMKVGIYVDRRRQRILGALEWPELTGRLTSNPASTPLHVLPLGNVNPQRLIAYMKNFGSSYSTVLAFRPTGWTYNERVGACLELIKPRVSGVVTIYGVPYSEHSSFVELREFVQFLRPGQIIPTVNVGSPVERDRMQSYFREWLSS